MIHSIKDTKIGEYISLVRNSISDRDRFAYVITFGCQQNERDSETAMGLCTEMGYKPAFGPEQADLIIINTCAIREHAETRALSFIGEYKHIKDKYPETIICVGGWRSLAEMEKILRDTKIEFLLLSRPLVREPDLPNKFLRGESKVSKCISCNACYSTPAHRCRFER